MKKNFLTLIILLIVVSAFGVWFHIFNRQEEVTKENTSSLQPESGTNYNVEQPIPPVASSLPSSISSSKDAIDVKIDFVYEWGSGWNSGYLRQSTFYTPEGGNEKYLSLSKSKKEEGQYVYGPDYYSIFAGETSHSYGGTPIYLLNSEKKYSVSYVGFKISDNNLISELKIEFGIDYLSDYGINKPKPSMLASIIGIESVYACGPGEYLRPVGSSSLIFVEEKGGIAWYRLEKPVALYNLNLNYCDVDCSSIPSSCHFWADDPPECDSYYCCKFNASISDLKDGNLRMHIYYKPNNKEGLLDLRVANIILIDPVGLYYQPVMGTGFDSYYRAYLH